MVRVNTSLLWIDCSQKVIGARDELEKPRKILTAEDDIRFDCSCSLYHFENFDHSPSSSWIVDGHWIGVLLEFYLASRAERFTSRFRQLGKELLRFASCLFVECPDRSLHHRDVR